MTRAAFVVELEKQGYVARLAGTPLLVFKPQMTSLVEALKALFVRAVTTASDFGWEEWTFPRIVAEEVIAATGWFSHHREEAFFINPKIERIHPPYRDAGRLGAVKFELYPKMENGPFALDPIQCASFYHAFANRKLARNELPVTVFEHAGGWTYRNEKNPDGLFRSLAFQRVELVWIGTQTQSKLILNDLIFRAGDFLRSTLEMEGVEAIAADCCFMEGNKPYDRSAAISAERVEKVLRDRSYLPYPAYDLVVTSDETDILEIASAGRHEALPRRFGIESVVGTKLESGCFGLGINRVAGEFLRQKGLDPANWPSVVRLKSGARP